MNIASDEEIFEMRFRKELPEELRGLNLRFDSARHVCRPDALEPSRQQNFVYDPVTNKILQLDTEDLYRQMPQSLRICRVFAHDKEHAAELGRAMNRVFDIHTTEDDDTNM